MSWGSYALVLEPASLKKEVKAEAERVIEGGFGSEFKGSIADVLSRKG
jgi:hypothetical protein